MTNTATFDDQQSFDETSPNSEIIEIENPSLGQGKISQVINSIKQFASVSEVMRVFGAIVMVASMSLFLVQGWTEQNDVQRYLKLLSQTGLLAGAGLLLSILLKEYRGARMFFGLSLVSVPVNFTVIGALIFSLFNVGNMTQGLPGFAKWVIVDGTRIGLVAAGAFALLLPVVWFAFRIMARRSAGKLTAAFMLLNMALLFPVRSGLLVAAVFSIAAIAAFFVERKLASEDETLTTPGGVFARFMLFVPALLVFVRSAGFYTFEPILNIIGALCIYLVTRYFAGNLSNNGVASGALRSLQAIAGFTAALFSTQLMGVTVFDTGSLVIANAVLALFMLDFRMIKQKRLASLVTAIIALILVGFNIFNVVFLPSMIGTTVAIAVGMFLIGYGAMFKQRTLMVAGGLIIAVASFSAINNFAQLLMNSGWVGLGVLGGIAIVGGSLLDRYGATVKLYLSNLSASKQ